MSVFLFKRFLTFIATLWATSIIVFLVLEVLPGDPALVMLGVDAPDSAIRALQQQLGLDRPAWQRYFEWVGGLVTGDLGTSYTYKTPVSELVLDRLAVSLPLALIAMVLTIVIALVLGLYAAEHHNKAGDYGVMGFSQLGIAIPNFWFGIILIIVFAVDLGWFRTQGFPGWGNGVGAAFMALILPALALALVQAAILARVTRSSILEVAREDFVRTARAKGLSRRATMWRHVLRNAMIPVITIMGLQFANLVAGTVVIENVFSLPGIGKLVFQAINNRDLPVVKDLVVLIAAVVVFVNFVVDLAYAVIDPRIKAHA